MVKSQHHCANMCSNMDGVKPIGKRHNSDSCMDRNYISTIWSMQLGWLVFSATFLPCLGVVFVLLLQKHHTKWDIRQHHNTATIMQYHIIFVLTVDITSTTTLFPGLHEDLQNDDFLTLTLMKTTGKQLMIAQAEIGDSIIVWFVNAPRFQSVELFSLSSEGHGTDWQCYCSCAMELLWSHTTSQCFTTVSHIWNHDGQWRSYRPTPLTRCLLEFFNTETPMRVVKDLVMCTEIFGPNKNIHTDDWFLNQPLLRWTMDRQSKQVDIIFWMWNGLITTTNDGGIMTDADYHYHATFFKPSRLEQFSTLWYDQSFYSWPKAVALSLDWHCSISIILLFWEKPLLVPFQCHSRRVCGKKIRSSWTCRSHSSSLPTKKQRVSQCNQVLEADCIYLLQASGTALQTS